jgi:hypothetical protein
MWLSLSAKRFALSIHSPCCRSGIQECEWVLSRRPGYDNLMPTSSKLLASQVDSEEPETVPRAG